MRRTVLGCLLLAEAAMAQPRLPDASAPIDVRALAAMQQEMAATGCTCGC